MSGSDIVRHLSVFGPLILPTAAAVQMLGLLLVSANIDGQAGSRRAFLRRDELRPGIRQS